MKHIPKISIATKPAYRKIAEDVNFFALFEAIEAHFPTCFLFESLGEEEKFSRYSIIGFDPGHIVSARDHALIVDGTSYKIKNPYDALRDIMPQPPIAAQYAGGLVGYLSYAAANYFEPALELPIHPDFGQFMFGAYTDGLILDKRTNDVVYFYYTDDRSALVERLLQAKPKHPPFHSTKIENSMTKKEHALVVTRVKERINAGDVFQCEVGFKTNYTVRGNTLGIYKNLRTVNPSPFMYYLAFGDKKIIGASPELLFSLRDGEMTTKPLAGTIRRGKTQKEDHELARQLLGSTKEKAEHTMLVDLHRNDIGRVARFGTVKLRDFMSVKKFSHVQHLSSEITGLIDPTHDMFSALAANFPAGTLTGAPKIEAMRIIAANEPEPRGPYGGAVGHFGFTGDCTLAIAIRSLFVSGERAYTQTSGGIVHDSKAAHEYDEIMYKLTAMERALTL